MYNPSKMDAGPTIRQFHERKKKVINGIYFKSPEKNTLGNVEGKKMSLEFHC